MKRLLLALAFVWLAAACATVPQNRRGKLADPIMQFESDSLDAHRKAKLYSTREAAAGGDGEPAGGGCGCQ
jgi:starvation-inducible outer membrane lipoprotein